MVALKRHTPKSGWEFGVEHEANNHIPEKMIKLKIPKKDAALVTGNDLVNEEMI
jgi:hypothetical protein